MSYKKRNFLLHETQTTCIWEDLKEAAQPATASHGSSASQRRAHSLVGRHFSVAPEEVHVAWARSFCRQQTPVKAVEGGKLTRTEGATAQVVEHVRTSIFHGIHNFLLRLQKKTWGGTVHPKLP